MCRNNFHDVLFLTDGSRVFKNSSENMSNKVYMRTHLSEAEIKLEQNHCVTYSNNI